MNRIIAWGILQSIGAGLDMWFTIEDTLVNEYFYQIAYLSGTAISALLVFRLAFVVDMHHRRSREGESAENTYGEILYLNILILDKDTAIKCGMEEK
jgi:hypothetical protein